MIENKKGRANPVDAYVGARVRLRRNILGFSQQVLAEKIGLTFQQLQKYERGVNRIGASRLYDLSKALSTTVSYFFDGVDERRGGPAEIDGVYALSEDYEAPLKPDPIMRKETAELLKAYYSIPDEKLRKNVLNMAKSLGKALKDHNTETIAEEADALA